MSTDKVVIYFILLFIGGIFTGYRFYNIYEEKYIMTIIFKLIISNYMFTT